MTPANARSIAFKFARVLSKLVYFWVIASLIILTLGFFLKLFAASPDAGFVEWVYRNLDRTMKPFRGMFPDAPIGDSGSVLDVSILFAMLVYGFVAIGFRALIDWLTVRLYRLGVEIARQEAAQEEALAAEAALPTSAAGAVTGAQAPGGMPTAAPPASPASPFDAPPGPLDQPGG
jgi:uncharacterized protein YggT (Ycf19 family)